MFNPQIIYNIISNLPGKCSSHQPTTISRTIKSCISEAHLGNAAPPTLVWIPNYPHQKLTWKVQLLSTNIQISNYAYQKLTWKMHIHQLLSEFQTIHIRSLPGKCSSRRPLIWFSNCPHQKLTWKMQLPPTHVWIPNHPHATRARAIDGTLAPCDYV